MSNRRVALPSLIAALAWGGMFPVAASALRHVDPLHLTSIRYLVAATAFVVLLRALEGAGALRTEGRALELFLLGSAGFAGFNLLSYVGLEHTRAQDAALIVATTPLLTAIAAWLLTRARPNRATLAAMGAALLGVLLVISRGHPSSLTHGGIGGDALVLAGAILWITYTMGARRFPGFSPLRYTALSAVGGTLTILTVTEAATLAGAVHAPSASDIGAIWWQLLYVAGPAAVVAVLAWNAGVRRLGAANGALFMNLVPVVTFAIAIAGGYVPVPWELAGAALTVAALVAANLAARAPRQPQESLRPSRLAWAATRSAKPAKSRA